MGKHPVNTTYRSTPTGRIYASPTNLPEIPNHYGIVQQQKYATP